MFRNIYIFLISIFALLFALIFILIGKLSIFFGAYSDVSLVLSRIPFLFGEKARFFYYKATLKHLGKDVIFKYGSFCQYPSAIIGDRVLFGYFNAIGEVQMGNDIVIGGFVNFISGTNQHSFSDPSITINKQKAKGRSRVYIGSDVWIGSNVVIASNIGDRCVIGAGSVVVKEVESFSVYAGNPAKLIKKIF